MHHIDRVRVEVPEEAPRTVKFINKTGFGSGIILPETAAVKKLPSLA